MPVQEQIQTFLSFSGTSVSSTVIPGHQGNPLMRTQTSSPRSNLPFFESLFFKDFTTPLPLFEASLCAFALDLTGPDRIRSAFLCSPCFPSFAVYSVAPEVITDQ
jgi:hypothetical protein